MTTSAGFVETLVPGGQTELDAGYATLLGSAPPGTTSNPVWIGGHNSTHGAVFGHIDNIANGTIVSVKSGSTTYTNTIQSRYLATVGDPAPTGHTFFLQTSAPSPSVWLIHN